MDERIDRALTERIVEPRSLEQELSSLLNSFSAENASDTPDFILARYLLHCLDSYAKATKERDRWYSFEPWGEK